MPPPPPPPPPPLSPLLHIITLLKKAPIQTLLRYLQKFQALPPQALLKILPIAVLILYVAYRRRHELLSALREASCLSKKTWHSMRKGGLKSLSNRILSLLGISIQSRGFLMEGGFFSTGGQGGLGVCTAKPPRPPHPSVGKLPSHITSSPPQNPQPRGEEEVDEWTRSTPSSPSSPPKDKEIDLIDFSMSSKQDQILTSSLSELSILMRQEKALQNQTASAAPSKRHEKGGKGKSLRLRRLASQLVYSSESASLGALESISSAESLSSTDPQSPEHSDSRLFERDEAAWKGGDFLREDGKAGGMIDRHFFRRCLLLWRLAVPTFFCKESITIYLLLSTLVIRTFLSIWIATINGSVVKTIVSRQYKLFVWKLCVLILYSLPASFINSSIEYLSNELALLFRQRLTSNFTKRYLHDKVFYHMTSLDCAISQPDQRLTDDVTKWSMSLASLFSNFTKPLLDIILLTSRLSQSIGYTGPLSILCWYALSALMLRVLSPNFGIMAAETQRIEGQYRSNHASIIRHSEEIAFYGGSLFEFRKLMASFYQVVRHTRKLYLLKLFMGCFDSLLVKYGAVVVGYTVVGLPLLTRGGAKAVSKAADDGVVDEDVSDLTEAYIRNSSLLINLAKAIGRLVVSYKDLQSLSGYTALICEFNKSIQRINKGNFIIKMASGKRIGKTFKALGTISTSPEVEFVDVPVKTPRGDVLIESLSFSVKEGMNVFILGPNGCGKSSLFRVLGELWPLEGGCLKKPPPEQIFYVPQRPYMPHGTLREQIIYPQIEDAYYRDEVVDGEIEDLLYAVSMGHLLERYDSGLNTRNNWEDQLSGGEKQRIALARLLYHKPVFAILDEATSAVSIDVEGNLYSLLKSRGISLITISHRMYLLKYHDFLLKIDSKEHYSYKPINLSTLPKIESYSYFTKAAR
uniref:ATP binding cassette subfamily D member 3 n=1 Tax=Nephromyces sp. MMRI TaxID=2496275 RepID=A0A3Q8UC31_9APIC|nr:ATP binding cassette subfamily D member 3 [Nephromyces sp. MMRI]